MPRPPSEDSAITAPLGRGAGDVRRYNLAALLGIVHQHGPVSRADLTRALGLNRSTVGDLVSDLLAAGLVDESSAGPASPGRVGRPSLVVSPRRGAAWSLAVHVDVHEVQVARVGLAGDVLDRRCRAHGSDPSPRDVAATVADLAVALTVDVGDLTAVVPAVVPADVPVDVPVDVRAPRGLAGIGVAVPGMVEARSGVVASAPHLGWVAAPVAELVQEALAARWGPVPVAVRVANDADLGVLAERTRGAAVGLADVVYLSGTYGLGGGIVSGGHPVTGSRGFAGEIGHMPVDSMGRACRCGSRGCWESEAGTLAWAEPLGLDAEAPDIARRIVERLALGGVAARRTRDRVSRTFARGLAGVINVFDPEAVILGPGLWHDLWPSVSDDVMPWVRRLVMPDLRESVTVSLAGLGADSTILGAAELGLAALLRDPLGRAPAR